MTLFVDQTGFPTTAEINIIETVTTDAGGMGDIPVPGDPTVLQITYTQSQSGFGQDRMNAVVNTVPNFIVVTGVQSSFLINGAPISNMAGITFVDGGVIRVIYDVNQCNGSFYFVFDSGGTQISFPNFVLVGHELAHAFHLAIGDSPPPGAAAEFQAITDENGYRTQNGFVLRDPNNHAGGCGFGSAPPPSSCFIATAAFGSSWAPQINLLRRYRDVLIRRSTLGKGFFDELIAAYYQFSPQVAERMRAIPDFKETMIKIAVAPFLDFLNMLVKRLSQKDTNEGDERLAQILPDCSNETGPSFDNRKAAAIARKLAKIQQVLESERPPSGVEPADDAPREWRAPAEVLDYLAASLTAVRSGGAALAWGLLEPLVCYWKAMAERGALPDRQIAVNLAAAIDHWLARVPIPAVAAELEISSLRSDLADLRHFLFVSSKVRHQVGRRLLDACSSRASGDLEQILKSLDYLPCDATAKELSHA